MVFGAASGVHMAAGFGSTIGVLNAGVSYVITGGATRHISATSCSSVSIVDAGVVLVGTPAFSDAFAAAALGGLVDAWGCAFTGSATGLRARADTNGIISTAGAGPAYFPGNAAPITTTGGQII